jgi:hypothetical protein
MSWLAEALVALWTRPSPAGLASHWEPAASVEEMATNWPDVTLPVDAIELWAVCRSARLYVDTADGQLGLALLSPVASAARTALERAARPDDLAPGDVVIGEFIGAEDLLVLAPSEAAERRVLVALPCDPRAEWYGVAESLGDFLIGFAERDGERWWEDEPAPER